MRHLIAVLTFILIAFPALAEGFSVAELREAVAARDFDAVNAGLEGAQSDFLAGDRSAEDIRDLFIALSRSAPHTITFVADWLERDPENPKAQIARAWSLYEAAGHIETGRNGYSYQVAAYMRSQSAELATSAYRKAPYLIPVSDAIIRNVGTVTDADVHPLEVMNGVLMAHPNWGSVQRAILSGHLRGTSYEMKRQFCRGAAHHFRSSERAALDHRCMMYLGVFYGNATAYLRDNLWSDDSPETVQDRLSYFIQNTDIGVATDAQITWAIDTLMTTPADQYQMVFLGHLARKFQTQLAMRPRPDGKVFDAFKKARLPEVEAFLEHDPNNLNLLDLAEGVPFAEDFTLTIKADGSARWSVVQVERTNEERVAAKAAENAHLHDFAIRRLRASPYGTEGWLRYAHTTERRDMPYSYFDGDDAYQNAILFADDPIATLAIYIHQKTVQWETVDTLTGGASRKITTMPEWSRFFETIDRDEAIKCPLLRAQLLREMLCSAQPGREADCDITKFPQHALTNTLTEVARNSTACEHLTKMDIEALWYEPANFPEIMSEVNAD